MVSNSYPTKPLPKRDPYSLAWLTPISLDYIKSISETQGIQIEITFKPEGIRVNLIRKNPMTNSVNRKSFQLENGQLSLLTQELNRNISTLFC